MSQLQLHSSPLQEMSSPCIGFVNKGGKFTHLGFRRSRINRYPSDGQLKAVQFYPQLRYHGDVFGPNSVPRQITFLNCSQIRHINSMMSFSNSGALSKNYCSQPAADDVMNRLRVKPFPNRLRTPARPFAAASNKTDANVEVFE